MDCIEIWVFCWICYRFEWLNSILHLKSQKLPSMTILLKLWFLSKSQLVIFFLVFFTVEKIICPLYFSKFLLHQCVRRNVYLCTIFNWIRITDNYTLVGYNENKEICSISIEVIRGNSYWRVHNLKYCFLKYIYKLHTLYAYLHA